ncbi:GNAT family N-acetyltransferase [Paenibacillus sp. FSL H7-0943]|uniref:GNAT family N-acetyltransferase n=1 Tax=Paenibacillus sp. FSL H7-0943 TaxID=2954739 RepID=UPI0030CE148B
MSTNEVIIAHYQEQDREAVSRLLVDAFHGKFHSLLSLEDNEIADLLIRLWEQDSTSLSSKQIIAYENGEVVGTIYLKWQDTISLKKGSIKPLNRAPFLQLFKKFGYLNVCKLILGLYFLDYQPRAKECYVAHLAVRSSHRNKGIGKELLGWAADFVNSHSEIEKLTLHVANKNKRAINMYQQLNFEIHKSDYSAVRHLLFKEPVWHYMIRKTSLQSGGSMNEKEN